MTAAPRPADWQGEAMDIATLQRLCARTWPGLEQDRLGEWELRAAGGFTGRANSALPLGDPGMPLPAALARVTDWYLARGLAPRLQLPAELPEGAGARRSPAGDPAPGVAALCDAQGWAAEPWTLVMLPAAPIPDPVAEPRGVVPGVELQRPEGPDLAERSLLRDRVVVPGVKLRWSEEPDEAWLNLYHPRGALLPPAARRVITAAPAHYLSVRAGGAVVGIGRASVAGGVVVLTAIEVVPAERRRGIGTLITEALAARGAASGAERVALQVFAHNAGAVALYRGMGFRAHHRYRYRYLPGR